MIANDRIIFVELMVQIGELYKQPMQEILLEIYWRALQRFELAEIKRALQAHVNHPDIGQYMPKPADIVRQLEGSVQTQALRAWSTVVRTIREVGGYSSVVFDDPLIHAVITDMGGWTSLCQTLIKNLPFREQDFVVRYVGYMHCPPHSYPRALTGMLVEKNKPSASHRDTPVCIGEQHKAWEVYQKGDCSPEPYFPLVREVTQHINSCRKNSHPLTTHSKPFPIPEIV